MRVTIGEMIGKITAKQGNDIERELRSQDLEEGQGAENRELQPSSGRVRVVEVQRKRPRPKR